MAVHADAAKARQAARAVVTSLHDAGHEAYFAGGCVRDELLGLKPSDYDVATDATPSVIASLFERTALVGASFGVVIVNDFEVSVEVATFRSDGTYSDGRRPDSVEFCDPVNDAQRRDFTVNALFLDPTDESGEPRSPQGGRVIDHVGGLDDLRAGVLRAVGVPAVRLAEDHLRALRAVRLTAKLSFTIEPGTATAITDCADELLGVSRERVGDEIRRMLTHPSRAEAVGLLCGLTLDSPVLQEPSQSGQAATLGGLPDDASFPASLAAWAIDRHSIDAPDSGRSVVRRWRNALCLSNDERDLLWSILKGVGMAEDEWDTLAVAARKRAASAAWFDDMMGVLTALDSGVAARVGEDVSRLHASPGGLAPDPLITGDDLTAIGLEPGPRFKVLLETAYDAQLEGRIETREQALELIRTLGV